MMMGLCMCAIALAMVLLLCFNFPILYPIMIFFGYHEIPDMILIIASY